jgi:2'-5' RNA ligase
MPHIKLVRRARVAKDIQVDNSKVIDETMKVNRISLMKSEQGKYGMIYTEIGYTKVK